MVTKEQLEDAQFNPPYVRTIELHYTGKHDCSISVGPKGGVTTNISNWRQSGRIKTWKRDKTRFEMPIKHGMYESYYVDQFNAGMFHLPDDCPIKDLHHQLVYTAMTTAERIALVREN